ncbi:hypothetical protein L1887_27703 [Cichorium endivia]|nr:hypothetical protein L1887_27703 [Cichorium endivia]
MTEMPLVVLVSKGFWVRIKWGILGISLVVLIMWLLGVEKLVVIKFKDLCFNTGSDVAVTTTPVCTFWFFGKLGAVLSL